MKNIKLKGLQSQEVNVTVSKSDLLCAAKQNFDTKDLLTLAQGVLYKKMNLPLGARIVGSTWVEDVEYYGSHSYISQEDIRPVTEEDKFILKIIEDLKKVH